MRRVRQRTRQLELDLQSPRRWGGRRRGAGRRPGRTPRVSRRGRAPARVALPVPCDAQGSPRRAVAPHSSTRSRVRAQHAESADRYHLHVLRTPREVRNALAYVLLNARRHLAKRGLRLAHAIIDPASSGRWFDGWRSGPVTAHDPPAVSQPRTWLLRSGQRAAIEAAAHALHEARGSALAPDPKLTLTSNKRPTWLAQRHEALDEPGTNRCLGGLNLRTRAGARTPPPSSDPGARRGGRRPRGDPPRRPPRSHC